MLSAVLYLLFFTQIKMHPMTHLGLICIAVNMHMRLALQVRRVMLIMQTFRHWHVIEQADLELHSLLLHVLCIVCRG